MNAPESKSRSTVHRIFFGGWGLRAGWGVLAFIALVALFGFAVLRFVPALNIAPVDIWPRFVFLREGILLLVIGAATFVMARIEGHSLWSYGLQGPGRPFLPGALWGFVLLSALIGLMVGTHHLAFDGRLLHSGPALRYGLAWGACFFLVAISEETLFRGYLLATLARGIGFWPAALLLSVTFGAVHLRNHGEDFQGVAITVLAGIVFSAALRLSGSLWWGIGFHTAWDWGQSFFYGTPDSGLLVRGHLLASHPLGDVRMSGGSVGPEGSMLVLPVLCIALVIMFATLKKQAAEPTRSAR